MILSIKQVELHNFGSYSDATVELTNRGFCFVSGINNYKKDNSLSNGCGKSKIFDGINYALTGETIKGSKNQLKNINVPENEMYVSLWFNFNDDEFIIKRGLNPSKFLYVYKNGTDVSGKTYTESVAKLDELLPDITKDLIASCLIIGQGMPNKFSSFTPAGRKEILEKLTKSDFMINDIKERLSKRQAELDKQLREYEDSILVNNTQLENDQLRLKTINASLASLIKPDFDSELSKIEIFLKQLEQESTTQQELKKQLTETFNSYTTQLVNINNEKQDVFTKELDAYNVARETKEPEKTKLTTQIALLENEIKTLKAITDICPTCGQKIPDVRKPDTTEKEKELTNTKLALNNVNQELVNMLTKHKSYIDNINSQYADRITELSNNINSVNKQLSDIDVNLAKNTLDYKAQVATQNKLAYEKLSWDNEHKKLTDEKNILDKDVNDLTDRIQKIVKLKEGIEAHITAVKQIDSVIKRDFRGYLLTGIIAELNNYAKQYAAIVFNTDEVSITVEGNALEITYCGKSIESLSGGETTRVDLILQLALRKLLQVYCNFNSNILVLDEVTDFLDRISCKAVMNLVKGELNKTESVFIISHHSEELEIPIDSELTITKDERGISTVA